MGYKSSVAKVLQKVDHLALEAPPIFMLNGILDGRPRSRLSEICDQNSLNYR